MTPWLAAPYTKTSMLKPKSALTRPKVLADRGLTHWLTPPTLKLMLEAKIGLDASKYAGRPRFDLLTDRPSTLKVVCESKNRPWRFQKEKRPGLLLV